VTTQEQYVLDVTHLPDGRPVATIESLTAMLRARADLYRGVNGKQSALAELDSLADSLDVTAISYRTENEHELENRSTT
jgi:hypothetical protein